MISTLGVLAALGTVLARNLVHAALFLVAFFFLVACQFVLLEAEFLAAVQVLVYIGAVAIIMMFGIMLTRNIQGDDTTTRPRGLAASPAGAGGLGLLGGARASGSTARRGRRPARPGRESTTRPGDRPPTSRKADRRGPRAINNMGRSVGDEMMTRLRHRRSRSPASC